MSRYFLSGGDLVRAFALDYRQKLDALCERVNGVQKAGSMTVQPTQAWLDELLEWERSAEFRALPLDYFTVKVEHQMARGNIIPLLKLMVSDHRCRAALVRMAQWEDDKARGREPYPRDDLTLCDQFTNWYLFKSGLRHRNSLYDTVLLQIAKSIVRGDLDVMDAAAINRQLDEREANFQQFVEGSQQSGQQLA